MEEAKEKIVKLHLFEEDFEIDVYDIDFEVFEEVKNFKEPNIENIEDVISFANKLDKVMVLLVGEKYSEIMKGKKRSIKTYIRIAEALKTSLENVK